MNLYRFQMEDFGARKSVIHICRETHVEATVTALDARMRNDKASRADQNLRMCFQCVDFIL